MKVQVGGRVSKTVRVLRVLVIVIAIALLILPVAFPKMTFIPGFFGIAFVMTMEISIFVIRLKEAWVTDLGSGFEYEDRQGVRQYTDQEIVHLNLSYKKIYSQGALTAIRRVFEVKGADDVKPIRFTNSMRPTKTDPLQELIDRLLTSYKYRASEALRLGARLAGKGWALTGNALEFGVPVIAVPLNEISAYQVIENELLIWCGKADEASLRVKMDTPNAFLLSTLLEDEFDQRPDEDVDVNVPGLGRQLFKRTVEGWKRALLLFFAVMVGLPGIGIFVAPNQIEVIIAGLSCLGASAILLFLSIRLKDWVFRCHERGVFKRGVLGMTELRYDEIKSFTYTAIKQYYNGIYIGTALSMRFEPLDNKKAGVRFGASLKNPDDALNQLRHIVSWAISTRMMEELAAGQSVEWTKRAIFHADQFEFETGGWFTKKERKYVRYSDVHAIKFVRGSFQLWVDPTSKRPDFTLPMATPNFFPGYYLLARMSELDHAIVD